MAKTISPKALHDLIAENNSEFAVVDVRGERAFSDGHLMHAISVPIGRLEVMIGNLVPRLGTPVYLTDGSEGLSKKAAKRLAEIGYTNVSILEGGTPGWAATGYEVYSGFNVPSKAFGEFVEHHFGTPSVSAEELKEMLDSGQKMVVLDSRPMDEFEVMNIPTATCCPGGELAYRIHEVAPDPETTVVVNCAGRTRSILGAQSLINSGIPNKVVALRNGTMGWHLSGFELERGNVRPTALNLSTKAIENAKDRANHVAERFGVSKVDYVKAMDWLSDNERTTFLLDVRHPHEYEAGHIPGSISAPGGQLVQATDRYAGVRGARLILVDDANLVRATMTAHWLMQMHWDVYVLEGGVPADGLETGKQPTLPLISPDIEYVDVNGAHRLIESGWIAVDVATSRDYRKGHIPDAWWLTRARIDEAAKNLPENAKGYVVTSEDGIIAGYAAAELAALTGVPAVALEGGTDNWKAAGENIQAGETNLADEPDDVWLKPYERKGGVLEDFMREYLTWEIDLIKQIDRDDLVSFRSM
ncbi:MAG: rhodanese-like domain-containing protein [Rhodospirillales bacterium]